MHKGNARVRGMRLVNKHKSRLVMQKHMMHEEVERRVMPHDRSKKSLNAELPSMMKSAFVCTFVLARMFGDMCTLRGVEWELCSPLLFLYSRGCYESCDIMPLHCPHTSHSCMHHTRTYPFASTLPPNACLSRRCVCSRTFVLYYNQAFACNMCVVLACT
jgi:hypothetical protein